MKYNKYIWLSKYKMQINYAIIYNSALKYEKNKFTFCNLLVAAMFNKDLLLTIY